MMKTLCVALGLALALVVVDVATADAAVFGDGNLNQAVLADFGLSGVQVMTDAQGERIRGKGYAIVFGVAWSPGGFRHYSRSGSSVSWGVFSSGGGSAAGGGASAHAN